jgi:hypothetical protein
VGISSFQRSLESSGFSATKIRTTLDSSLRWNDGLKASEFQINFLRRFDSVKHRLSLNRRQGWDF